MKSPGHEQHPEHQVREQRARGNIRVEFNGETLAQSSDVIEVLEDKSPARYYFPRADVRMDALSPGAASSDCPFKGHATYFDIEAGGQRLPDAVWTYEKPYDEHAALAGRLAFYDDKYPGIRVIVNAD